MPRMPSYLITNRFGVYHFNMVVPKDLLQIVGKDRVRKSLETKDQNQAIELARVLTVQTTEWFKQLRNQPTIAIKSPLEQPLPMQPSPIRD